MRAAVLLVLAALLAPTAAAGLNLPAGRTFEDAVEPGGAVTFHVPVEVDADGALYAKALPTPGNVVTDDMREDERGWRVTYALVREGEAPLDMGTYADNTMSALAPVRAGERLGFRVTVHAPADAPGGKSEAFVALAFRTGNALDGSAPNGAHMDAARALTLVLHVRGDGLSTPDGEMPPPVGPIDFEPNPASPATGTGTGTTPGGADIASGGVAGAMLPTWFLVLVVLLLSALVLTTGACAYALLGMLAFNKREADAERKPVAVPVRAEKAKVEPPPRER